MLAAYCSHAVFFMFMCLSGGVGFWPFLHSRWQIVAKMGEQRGGWHTIKSPSRNWRGGVVSMWHTTILMLIMVMIMDRDNDCDMRNFLIHFPLEESKSWHYVTCQPMTLNGPRYSTVRQWKHSGGGTEENVLFSLYCCYWAFESILNYQ